MQLWTFQSNEAEEQLEKRGILHTEWSRTPLSFRPAYQWMTIEMEKRGLPIGRYAPIWAWHSCSGTLYNPPTLDTVRHLLTDYQIMSGSLVIEFEAPDELCLLSSYGRFVDMIDRYLDGAKPDPDQYLDMFNVPPLSDDDDIQAALPYLKMEWVTDRRPIDIKPGKWDYDWRQKV